MHAANASRILVVDDERTNREILARLLQRNGYQTESVGSAEAALERLKEQSFDVVLLDVVMPEMDGFECLRRIRRSLSVSELPVIMITAEADRDRIIAAFRDGANDYVTKPIDRDVTLARIATHAQLRQTMRALRDSEERYALAARGSNDGLWDWNVQTGDVYYSPRWKSMLGLQDTELERSSKPWIDRVHPDDHVRFCRTVSAEQDQSLTHLDCELRMLHQDGSYRWMLCRGVYVRNAQGQVYRMAGSLTDITEGKVGDALTGLPNRLLFVDRLERTIERARRLRQGRFAVLFLDLDNFKLINDSFGHQAGDRLLVEIARRLEQSIRSVDCISRCECNNTVARHAGDEFTILLESLNSPEDADVVADRILQAFAVPVNLDSVKLFPTFSIGLAVGDQNTVCAEDLMREADTAMYYAKSEGRNRRRKFEHGMQQRATERLALEHDLRRALQAQEFVLHYQPIVQLDNLLVTGFESLVRWQHPIKGLISPMAFIGAAEEMGLIVPLGWWIVENACQQAALWQAQFPDRSNATVNINCSVTQLYEPEFVKKFHEIIIRTGVVPHGICIEVTESTLMDRPDAIRPILCGLRDLGVQISIDDFGTGYSSLAYLHRFPLDSLKIDQSFVNTLHDSQENSEIVRTIINLAHRLGLHVVAEGVETERQWTTLSEFGATHAQGFLFSPPVGASYASKFLLDCLGSGLFSSPLRSVTERSAAEILPMRIAEGRSATSIR